MNRIATSAIAAAAFFALGAAQASVTTFETASSSAGPQASAGAYQSVVDAAMTGASAQLLVVPAFDGLSNHGTFGGGTSDIAYRATVTFGVTAGQAGSWDLRAGVDFGRGGAVFLDGVALAFNNNNMWWQGSYADTTQSFQFTTTVTAGNHTLKIVGLEDCCDAGDIGQQAQFRLVGGNFTTFGATDGLAAAVPEPGTYALMGFGLAGLAFAGRRRSAAKAA
jgi:hypothetical protein